MSRRVPDNTPMVTFESGQYSVPASLLGAKVFVRSHGLGLDEQVIVIHEGRDGPVEVARHRRARPGSPAISDVHFPDHAPKIPGDYMVKARSAAEMEFLAIGGGARTWLLEAAAVGTMRISQKMAEAVALAKIAGQGDVDQALGTAAIHGRFAHKDLASILNAAGLRSSVHTASESQSLTQGTRGWAAIGQLPVSAADDLLEESA